MSSKDKVINNSLSEPSNLSNLQIDYFVKEYTNGKICDKEMEKWLKNIFHYGMTYNETLSYTQALINSGSRIEFPDLDGYLIDKHSTGGVGDKVSFVLGPILAACGCYIPMLAGRGLEHTGGTIDKLESIPGYRTQLSLNEFKKIVLKVGISIMCQTGEICPADEKIYALRDVSKTVASNPLICGSILSKKIAEGIEGLVLDIKVGNGAFMESMDAALKLGQLLGKVGKNYGINISICYTSMEQPLGNNCGLWCEIIESLDCLKGRGPQDIMDVVFYLGDKALRLAGYKDVKKKMIKCIEDRSALNIFLKMIECHGGDIKSLYDPEYNKPLFLKKYKIDKVGYIKSIDTRKIGNSLVKLGCGRERKNDKLDFTAGFKFYKKVGDFINSEDIIFEYFCSNQRKINQVQKFLDKVIILDVEQTVEPNLILS